MAIDAPRTIGRVGTTHGRVVEVSRTIGHVIVRDPAVPHSGSTLALNTDQARKLAEMLLQAVGRGEC